MSACPRSVLIVVALLVAATWAGATTFPTFIGEDLDGRAVTLPQAVKGQPALLIISFARKAQAQTAQWGDQVCKNKADARSVCLQMMVLEDVPKLFRGVVKHSIAKSIPSPQHPQFLLVFQGADALKRLTSFEREEDAYLVVLDSAGDIVWQGHGAVDGHKQAELVERLRSSK
jgi:hypothetical protein